VQLRPALGDRHGVLGIQRRQPMVAAP
jgi:hypothetical protein